MPESSVAERISSFLVAAVISVAMGPGATAFTRRLSLASSSAIERVNPLIADFDAAYAAACLCPTRPIWLEIKTRAPDGLCFK